MPGVYEIVNLTNGNRYIGSAVQPSKRRRSHFSQLRRGVHHNQHLQSAFLLYGEAAFRFEVVVTCKTKDLIEEEQIRLDLYDAEDLYNGRMIASSNLGLKMSESSRAKMSAAQTGRTHSEASKNLMSKLTSERPITWRLKLAEAATGRVLSQETKSKISVGNRGKTVPEWAAKSQSKPYPALIGPDGTVYPPGSGLRTLCRRHGLDQPTMRRMLRGEQRQHKGWRLAETSE
jgi:group I intron endonuclease